MGKKDLGKCLILTKNDIKDLGCNLSDFEILKENAKTPRVTSTESIKKRCYELVEASVNKINGDLAIIKDGYNSIPSSLYISSTQYVFDIYRKK